MDCFFMLSTADEFLVIHRDDLIEAFIGRLLLVVVKQVLGI